MMLDTEQPGARTGRAMPGLSRRTAWNRLIFLKVVLSLSARQANWTISQVDLVPWVDQIMTQPEDRDHLIGIATAIDLLDTRAETQRLTKAIRKHAARSHRG